MRSFERQRRLNDGPYKIIRWFYSLSFKGRENAKINPLWNFAIFRGMVESYLLKKKTGLAYIVNHWGRTCEGLVEKLSLIN